MRASVLTGLLFIAFISGMAVRAHAETPPGTWIYNTAQIDYAFPTGIAVTTSSNAADTVLEGVLDTTAPTILSSRASPSSVTNGGATVVFTVSAVDFTAVKAVMIHLSMLGKTDSFALRNDGVAPDTTAGDSIWNIAVTIDSTSMGDTFLLPTLAIDSSGNQASALTTLVVTDTSPPMASIISLGWNFSSGVRIAGNAVTLSVGQSTSMAKVLFQYRSNSSSTWNNCLTGIWSDPNPDTSGPVWAILWNMESLPDDTYIVRAVGYNLAGNLDPSPSFVKVVKDGRDSWINEWNDTAANIHVRRHRYLKSASDTVVVVDGTMFAMDTSAMGDLNALWIRITEFRNHSPAAPPPVAGKGLVIPGNGFYRRFEREDGESLFSDSVYMEIPYTEEGLTVPEDDLAIYRYDTVLKAWLKEAGSAVDKGRHVVTLRVRHFTDFAVFGAAPSATLADVLIYPNPYIPYDGDPQTGQPFVRGDNTTGIIFRNVTSTVDIDIFTIAGRKVSTIRSTNSGGNLQWDARTDDNREVASGVYIAVIRAPSGERVVKKFMVIR